MIAKRKLNSDDVRLIRELCDERRRLEAEIKKVSNRAIAEKFDIVQAHVSRIDRRVMWGSV